MKNKIYYKFWDSHKVYIEEFSLIAENNFATVKWILEHIPLMPISWTRGSINSQLIRYFMIEGKMNLDDKW